jgi:mono/diheme cytochrome c family protein
MTTRMVGLVGRNVAVGGLLACLVGLNAGAVVAAEEKESSTFNKDVAPLLFAKCASCHRPGEVAPFPLLTYRDAQKRARLLREVTASRTMPPWKAVAGVGHFTGERRLSDEEIATIARWVDEGAIEGDPDDLPAPPRFATGWQLGEPDMVLAMDEPYTLAAEGRDEYRCFVIPVKIPPGKYIKAVEYRPENRRIVHHAVLATLPHRAAQAMLHSATGNGKSFTSGLAPPGRLLPGQITLWTPGMASQPLPDGFAAEWPEGSDLILQLHFHPSGKPEDERSSIGLHFTDVKPEKRLELRLLSNNKIAIEPGVSDHEVKASLTFKQPVELYGVFPHMHLIGRTVDVTAIRPDGTREPLISIDDWDFNWQYYYTYAKPVRLPAGTRIEGRFTYDNSPDNPANPSRPPVRVTSGEQTVDEMAIMTLDYVSLPTDAEEAAAKKGAAAGNDAINARIKESFDKADRDGNAKLDLEEIRAAFGKSRGESSNLEKLLLAFDTDGDKQLDPKELADAFRALTPH